MPLSMKLLVGQYWFDVDYTIEGGRLFFQFRYNKPLMAEIKSMNGAKWHGYDDENPRKVWSITNNERNQFRLAFLQGLNPYLPYDGELDVTGLPTSRFHIGKNQELPLFIHQPFMIAHILQRRCCILAAEMGTSKTLSDIIAMEIASAKFRQVYGTDPEIWYIAPKAAIVAVKREFFLWKAKVNAEFMTPEGLVKRMKEWVPGKSAPYFVTFDESSKYKNSGSLRTQCADRLAAAVREEWPRSNPDGGGFVVEMTGSPAPKSPIDWYSQAEIACPGYVKEGDVYKFKNRLAIIVKKEGVVGGGVYPELVSWRDDDKKCNVCGQYESAPVHNIGLEMEDVVDTGPFPPHPFEKSINEVSYLSKRLSGLVFVRFKKDCLDLPDKIYRPIELKPTPSMQRAAKLLLQSSKTVIEGLIRVRELSDGFQYKEVVCGDEACSVCEYSIEAGKIKSWKTGEDGTAEFDCWVTCPNCGGTMRVKKFERQSEQMKNAPKDEALRELLDEYEDVGRVVIFAGFTASIDRVVEICRKEGWAVIRLDAKHQTVYDPDGKVLKIDYLTMFQDQKVEYPRVAFVAHPASGGMSLTLTASPVTIYFSNDFNAENRIQSEDRIHRPGMDLNLGATIIDLIHLNTDKKILENLKLKRDLQSLTLGEFLIEDTGQAETR